MITQVPGADGSTVHTVDTDEIVQIDGGTIDFSAKGNGSGRVTGASVRLRDGTILSIDWRWATPLITKVQDERR